MSAIRLDKVSKAYGTNDPVVRDVSLDIDDGEFVILVGPSGSGKSTLLRMIVGLEDVTSGDVFIGGDNVTGKPPRDRNLAMVFQNYALYPHLTVFENIAFPLRLRKTPPAEITRRVEDAAETLDLTDYLQRKPAQLSGGQRQRVAMGRALVREADAFLFDEPLSNLDAKLRGQVRTEIARLQDRLGVTTVYVTHDQVEAMTLGDRVAVLRKGVLQQVASPRELYDDPVNLFVAGFIGSPAMNFLPAQVSDGRLSLPIADVPLTPALAAAAEGHDVLLAGLRPESFEALEMVPEEHQELGVPFRATVDVVEWLGSEQYAYIPFDVPPEIRGPLAELAEELDSEQLRTQIVVNVSTESHIRPGQEADLWLDPRELHLFDPHTGDNLTLS
ncbi:MAG TPA: sn-glycerol-3-phosphate ABC transporter ATP-binding protein UgpC [Acidimicrobiales bacterium]|nr:sn-glycerol-3-phosphate ABC transporter ATP-binding protein UgpC [Acidimicrobiales bacterium]